MPPKTWQLQTDIRNWMVVTIIPQSILLKYCKKSFQNCLTKVILRCDFEYTIFKSLNICFLCICTVIWQAIQLPNQSTIVNLFCNTETPGAWDTTVC